VSSGKLDPREGAVMASATGLPESRGVAGGLQPMLSRKKWAAAAALCMAAIAAVSCVDKWVKPGSSAEHPIRIRGTTDRALQTSPFDSIPKVNTAIILIKPHAGTDAVMRHIQKRLRAEKVQVLRRGKVVPEAILGFLTSSSGSAGPAMSASPGSLEVTDAGKAAFLAAFGKKWDDALVEDTVRNAAETLDVTDLTEKMLYDEWKALTPGKTVVKLLSDVYVGKIDGAYIINGFFPAEAKSYHESGTDLRYLEVQWKPARLSYVNFTAHVIGSSDDPAATAASSLRHQIYQNWQRMGLEAQPDSVYNSVVASTSAYAGWLDAATWTMQPPEFHSFGRSADSREIGEAAFGAGLTKELFIYNNKEATLTEHLKGLDRMECLDTLAAILGPNGPS